MSFIPREKNFIVIEPGSSHIKAEVASYLDIPHQVPTTLVPSGPNTFACGDEIENLKKTNNSLLLQGLSHPIQDSIVLDWTCLEKLLYYILVKKLRVVREKNDKPVMMNVPLSWTREDLQHVTRFMFETMNVPGFYAIEQPLATVYGYGVSSGLVLDVGFETTDVACVLDGNVLRQGALSIPIGGKDISNYLQKLLESDKTFSSSYPGLAKDKEFLQTLLRTPDVLTAFIPGIVEEKKTPTIDFEYKNRQIKIGSCRLTCTNVLFDPTLVGKQEPGLPELLSLVINASVEPEKRLFFWENIGLSGGVTALSGLKPRLELECKRVLAASETSNEFQAKDIGWLKIPDYFTTFKERNQDMSFVGASVVAKVSFFSTSNYITKSDYNEYGPAVIQSK